MAKQTAAFKRRERERHRRRNLRKRRAAERDLSALLSSTHAASEMHGFDAPRGQSDEEIRERLEQAVGVDLDTGRPLR